MLRKRVAHALCVLPGVVMRRGQGSMRFFAGSSANGVRSLERRTLGNSKSCSSVSGRAPWFNRVRVVVWANADEPRIRDSLKGTMKRFSRVLLAGIVLATTFLFFAQQQMPKDDLTPGFKAPEGEKDYIQRVEMVPMRDGVKLYTVIVIPKGAHDAPMMLTRTPYNAASRAERTKDAA